MTNQQSDFAPSEDSDQPGHRPSLITHISLGIRPVWSESSLSAWRKLRSLPAHWAHSEDSDQTGRMPRLIWVFTGRTLILLVLSRGGSNSDCYSSQSISSQKYVLTMWATAFFIIENCTADLKDGDFTNQILLVTFWLKGTINSIGFWKPI